MHSLTVVPRGRRSLVAILTVLRLTAPAELAAQEKTLVLLNESPHVVELRDLDEQSLTFSTDEGTPQSVSLRDVVRWGVRKDPGKGPQIVLSDGSVVVADIVDTRRDAIVVGLDPGKFGEAPLWNDVTIPLKHARGIIFRPPAAPLDRDQLLLTLQTAPGNSDRLLLENGDVLEGTLIPAPPEGANEAPAKEDPDSLWLRMSGRAVPVPRTKITGLVFNPALTERLPESDRFAFGFGDGSFLYAARWSIEEDQVQLTHPSGLVFEMERGLFYDELVFFQPPNPRVRYLSDTEPVNYRHVPFLELKWPYAEDQSVVGGQLRFGGDIYPKGLGMHSASRLVYPLKAGDKRFAAELALDDEAGERGSVVYEVLVLRESWQRAYESPVLRGSDRQVHPLSLDVSGGRALVLAIRYADYGDLRDYANWLEARIYQE